MRETKKTQFLSRDIINNDKTERKMKKKHDIQKYGNYISMTDSQMRACVPYLKNQNFLSVSTI